MILMGIAATLWFSGCTDHASLRRKAPAAGSKIVELSGTPFFSQIEYQCGPASLATVLTYAGKKAKPQELAERVYLPGRQGTLQVELLAATRREGMVPYTIKQTLDALIDELRAGRPVVVLQNLGPKIIPILHYSVVIGHDPDPGMVILRSGTTRRKVVPVERFLASWEGAGSWGFVVLVPGELPTRPNKVQYLKAVAAMEAVGQHDAALRAYQAALKHWPEDATAQLGVGNSWYGLGELLRAESAYRRLIKKDPGNIAGYNNLAQVLADQKRYDQALAVAARGLSLAPDGHDIHRILRETQAEIRQNR